VILISIRSTAACIGRSDANHAQRHIGRIVLGVHSASQAKALEQAVFDHGARAGVAFFAGLENQSTAVPRNWRVSAR
jgi:hypothetical protein